MAEEAMTITFEEAKRRKAVANMIISEINVLETLQNAAPLSDAEGYPFEGVVGHRRHGWLYSAKQLQAAVETAEAGGSLKQELDRVLKIDR